MSLSQELNSQDKIRHSFPNVIKTKATSMNFSIWKIFVASKNVYVNALNRCRLQICCVCLSAVDAQILIQIYTRIRMEWKHFSCTSSPWNTNQSDLFTTVASVKKKSNSVSFQSTVKLHIKRCSHQWMTCSWFTSKLEVSIPNELCPSFFLALQVFSF